MSPAQLTLSPSFRCTPGVLCAPPGVKAVIEVTPWHQPLLGCFLFFPPPHDAAFPTLRKSHSSDESPSVPLPVAPSFLPLVPGSSPVLLSSQHPGRGEVEVVVASDVTRADRTTDSLMLPARPLAAALDWLQWKPKASVTSESQMQIFYISLRDFARGGQGRQG